MTAQIKLVDGSCHELDLEQYRRPSARWGRSRGYATGRMVADVKRLLSEHGLLVRKSKPTR